LRGLLTFAYITGWRIKSEVQSLKWSEVNLGTGVVRLEPGVTKNGEPREFPITEQLRLVIETQAAKAERLLQERSIFAEHVFFWDDGRQIKNFRGSWLTACVKAGLAEQREVGKDAKGNAVFDWKATRIPHDFRRTAIRNLIRAHVDRDTAMKLVGQLTPSVFSRYNIVDTKDLEQAGQRLDEYLGTKRAKGRQRAGETRRFGVLDSRK